MRILSEAALGSESLFWRHIRGSSASSTKAGLKAKKSEGRVCLRFPWERKWRTENTELRARAAPQKARASCLSRRGTSVHVSTSCPQKTGQALCRALVCPHAGRIWPRSISRLHISRHQNSFYVGVLRADIKNRG